MQHGELCLSEIPFTMGLQLQSPMGGPWDGEQATSHALFVNSYGTALTYMGMLQQSLKVSCRYLWKGTELCNEHEHGEDGYMTAQNADMWDTQVRIEFSLPLPPSWASQTSGVRPGTFEENHKTANYAQNPITSFHPNNHKDKAPRKKIWRLSTQKHNVDNFDSAHVLFSKKDVRHPNRVLAADAEVEAGQRSNSGASQRGGIGSSYGISRWQRHADWSCN